MTIEGLRGFGNDSPEFLVWQERVKDANISEQTLLATDYLNHFNEIVMLLEMVPDMPDMLEDCRAWAPKSYQDHFRDSSFSKKDLAIAAYDHVPPRYKIPFEDCVAQMNTLVAQTIAHLEAALDDPDMLRARAEHASRGLQRLMDVAGAIIHGSEKSLDQSEIDDIFQF